MNKTKTFLAGAAYGLLMRIVFGTVPMLNHQDGIKLYGGGPMLASFVVLVPLLIGIYTVYSARDQQPGIGFALWAPWGPHVLLCGGHGFLAH